MSILGHGIDLVDVEEIATLLTLSDDFLNRCFTDLERQRLAAISANPERVAARFAAKEAVLKALGKGDPAPKFYPVLSSLRRFVVAAFCAVAAGCGAEPFRLRSAASRRGLMV